VLGLGAMDRLLLANITPQAQRIALAGPPRKVSLLGGDGVDLPACAEILLPAYGCVEIVL
jgi:hypothetical protein